MKRTWIPATVISVARQAAGEVENRAAGEDPTGSAFTNSLGTLLVASHSA
jgi:hypothetical protein